MNKSFGDIANGLFGDVLDIRGIIRAVCIIAGIALILGSIHQYKKHRNNPIEVPLGTPIIGLLAGLGLIALSFVPLQL